jgi:WD40 repeat protein
VGILNITAVYEGVEYPRPQYALEVAELIASLAARFVGRDQVIQQVMEFLEGPPGYLLISGEGGAGKSTLIASLIDRYTKGMWPGVSPTLLYYFIRSSGERDSATTFLQCVNAELLDLLKLPGGTPSELAGLRAQWSYLWSAALQVPAAKASPLLLLVDALDEMAEGPTSIAELLPSGLGNVAHVLVTSRPHPNPRDRVSRDHPLAAARELKLDRFSRHEIELMLSSPLASAPFATSAVAARIVQLTKGEPLFSRFVADEVKAHGLSALDLLEQHPPVDAEHYFHEQMQRLKRIKADDTWDLLGLLAVAEGGLIIADFSDLLGRRTSAIREALRPIERFLLGDQQLELFHQNLRVALENEFSPQELGGYRKQYLNWCQRYAEARWPIETSRYLLSYTKNHLLKGNRGSDWRHIVSSLSWLWRKSLIYGFPAALQDLYGFADDAYIQPLIRVCRASAHLLANDPRQLASQVLARLDEESTELRARWNAEATIALDVTWLRPLYPSLSQIQAPLRAVFRGREADGHAGTPRSICFSKDGGLIATAGNSRNDGTVKIWSCSATTVVRSLPDAAVFDSVTPIAFLVDEPCLAVGQNEQVCVYDLETAQVKSKSAALGGIITCLAMANSSRLIVGTIRGEISAWRTGTSDHQTLRPADGHAIRAVCCSVRGGFFACLTDTKIECYQWNRAIPLGMLLRETRRDQYSFAAPALWLSNDGMLVRFGSPVQTWNVRDGTVLNHWPDTLGHTLAIAADGASAILATGTGQIDLALVNLPDGVISRTFTNTREISCLAISPDRRVAAFGDFEHDVKVWDLSAPATKASELPRKARVLQAVVDDSQRVALFSRDDHSSDLWDLETGHPLASVEQQSGPSFSLQRCGGAIESDDLSKFRYRLAQRIYGSGEASAQRLGSLAISRSADRAVWAPPLQGKGSDVEEVERDGDGLPLLVWLLSGSSEPRELFGHNSPISCVAITCDGRRGVSGSRGRVVRVWDLDEGSCIATLRGHRGIILCAAISSDGRWVVSGSEDMTLRLWDVETAALVATFTGASAITACDVSRSGEVIVAGEVSGCVHLLRVEGRRNLNPGIMG